MDEGQERISFAARRAAPPGFDLRTIRIEPGEELPFREADWADALVVLEEGAIEIECLAGARRRFEAHAVLWLAGLAVRLLRNLGAQPAVLSAVARQGGRPRRLACVPENGEGTKDG